MRCPVSLTPCCWYRFTVEEEQSDNKWSSVNQGSSIDHFLLDDSGACVVSPDGAEVVTSHHHSWREGRMRYSEWLLLPEAPLYAIGEFVTHTANAPSVSEEREDVSQLQSPEQNPLSLMLPLSRSPNLKGAWDMGIQPDEGGLTLHEMLDEESEVKGIILFGDDLLNHLPSSSMVAKFKNLEFVLVADRFFTETARMAHCVLPIPLLAETQGTMTNSEGRVQKLRPFVDPQQESRSVAQILHDLSLLLGKHFAQSSEPELRKQISKSISLYAKVAS